MSAVLTGVFLLGQDPELRYLPSGEAVLQMSLAYAYGRKKDGEKYRPTQWVDAAMWGKRAESVAPHLGKGSRIFAVVEDLHIETYDRRDGAQGVKLTGRVASLAFAGGDREAEDSGASAPPPRRPAAPAAAPAPAARKPAAAPAAGGTGFDDMDDDIPFVTASPALDLAGPIARRMRRYGGDL